MVSIFQFFCNADNREEKGELYLELGYISLHYLQYNSAKVSVESRLVESRLVLGQG